MLVAGSLFGLANVQVSAAVSDVEKYIENPEVVGKTRLKVLFWNIYDATLYASQGKWNSEQPYALALTYLRDFEGKSIASRSIDEMRDQGYSDDVKLATWYEQMNSLFPDVKEGETITGISDGNKTCHFYKNGELLGSIDDPEFTQQFFDIWLSEKTSEPKMRKELLGKR